MSPLLNLLARAFAGGSVLALPIAFAGGLVAALNPCCLALYPAAAATCCGAREARARRSLPNSTAFVVGMAMAMALLGTVAALAGRIVSGGSWVRYAVAVVPLVMGMQVLGWLHLPLPAFSMNQSKLNVASAFGCGFLLSLVIAPCATPVLASVLSYAALKGNAYFGALLLFVYGLGAGIPLLTAATLSSHFAQALALRGYRKWVDAATGALLLWLGLYLLWIA